MPIKPIKEIHTDSGGNVTVEYSDDSTMKFNQADTVTAVTNPVTGGIASLQAGGQNFFPDGLTSIQRLRDKPVIRIAWWGDSTVDAAGGGGLIPSDWSFASIANQPHGILDGVLLNKNFGANGYSTSAILAASDTATNQWNNKVNPEGVGAACLNVADALAITFGINDFRMNTSVATYGNQAMITEVLALQARLVEMIRRVRVAAGVVPVIFVVPNVMAKTGPLLSVDGQAVTDALRLAYLGDGFLGIPAMKSLVANSDTCDAGGVVFGRISPTLAAIPPHMIDELHPNSDGYNHRMRYFMVWIDRVCREGEFLKVSSGSLSGIGVNYFDYGTLYGVASKWGAQPGTGYGVTTQPGLGVGDDLAVFSVDGKRRSFRIAVQPGDNAANNYLRWYQSPDGRAAFPTDVFAPELRVLHLRRKIRTWYDAIDGWVAYPVRVTAGGNGTLTVRSIQGGLSLLDHPPVVADRLAIQGMGGGSSLDTHGHALTGATIVAGSGIGAFNISGLAHNYTHAAGQLGSLLVPNR